jgi:hypothetical protein
VLIYHAAQLNWPLSAVSHSFIELHRVPTQQVAGGACISLQMQFKKAVEDHKEGHGQVIQCESGKKQQQHCSSWCSTN